MTAVDLLSAALRYARAGLPVVPLNGKIPRTAHGYKDATTDSDQIRAWWRCWPEANVGIRTGQPLRSGGFLAVLDVDPRNGGDATLRALEAEPGALPATFTVRTGGGGWHFYYRTEAALGCRGGIADGLDVKGTGGYVVAPPSLHPDGPRYGIDRRDPVAPIPAWLLRALTPPRFSSAPLPPPDASTRGSAYARAAIERECIDLARAPKGVRNAELNRSAYALARFVASGEADAPAVVRALTYAASAAGLPEREIARTLQSAFRARQVAA